MKIDVRTMKVFERQAYFFQCERSEIGEKSEKFRGPFRIFRSFREFRIKKRAEDGA
jgi:hypothetical protein